MNCYTERKTLLAKVFQERFASLPTFWCRAPGRVDLMGSHTDYNLGYVLTLPIGRDTWMAARSRGDKFVRLFSINFEAEAGFDLAELTKDSEQPWTNYVRGVAWALNDEKLPLRGFDAVIHSTVPISSGLSSSAALECVTATVFEQLGGWKLDPVKKALLCQKAENQFVGVNCGILDQYTSCLGRKGCALLLDCRDLSSRPVEIAQGIQVVICDTKSKRELTGSEYGTRRSQCEEGAKRLGVKALREATLPQLETMAAQLPSDVVKRCRFIIEENARVLDLAQALAKGDRTTIRQLCGASFDGAMNLYEIGAPAMHSMMQAMLAAPGVIGARQAGAGFGGCMVAFVESPQVPAFTDFVRQEYQTTTNLHPEIYPVEAAAGAGLVE